MEMNAKYKWIALSITSLGTMLSIMTSNTLMIALPTIVKDLSTSMGIVIWVLMSYMLAITILVPAIGRIVDIVGRKKLYILGFGIFTLTSLVAGLAQTGLELLLVRIVQSIGGALILANGSAIITDAFPKNELGKALGINGMIISVGAAIAPLVGGFITLRFGWRWVFFFNVPLGLLGTLWAAIAIHETAILPKGQHFDFWGALLFGVGMFLLLLALSLGGFNGWGSPLILWLFISGALLLSIFVFVEMHVAEPLFDIELFKSKTLSFAFLATLLNGIARGALIFLLIFYLQGVRAMDPLLAGLYIMPFSIGLMIISPISGSLADRYGSQILSTLGLSLSAIGLLGYTWIRADTPISQVILWQTIVGIGSGFFNSPNSNTIMGAVRPERRGIAAGTRTMMLNAGSVISLAMTFAIISSGLTQEAMQGLFAGTQVGSEGIAIDQFIHDLHIAFFISFCISTVAAIISFVRGPKPKNIA